MNLNFSFEIGILRKEMPMTKEQEKLKQSWLQIMTILKETGYDYLYMEDVSRVASVIRKEIGLDKEKGERK